MKTSWTIKLLAGVSLVAFFAAHESNRSQFTADSGNASQRKLDEATHFLAAILRSDGTLIPFAQYSNGGWANPWPAPRQNAESIYAETQEMAPHSLGNLSEPWFKECGRLPKTWYFWSGTTTATVLNASAAVQVENHSQTNWALSTDLAKQTADDDQHHHLGIALTVKQKVEPLIEIKSESSETKANSEIAELVSFIKELFDNAETTELEKIHAQRTPARSTLSMPASGEERAKVRMSITKLYRTTTRVSAEYLYYFEAEKRYEKPARSDYLNCADVSLFQGWITTDGRGGAGLMDSRVFFTDCDMKGPDSWTPLGLLRLNNATLLFVSEHGWEDESYLILEVDRSGLHKVLETFGG